ncbi:DnaJ family domain-containing protein [Nigerium massiliense]|uniref:DnaJ family domain-containing protein n=1 Tax=Nigerium massiliense TaxID=1522317 RepID=UPI00058BF3CA|nr:DUF1992 domain-containing protein [Nigerium massiliense]
MQFESWIDRQVREAIERGEFDNLPGAGKPLDLDDSEDWWIKAKIKRENLEPVLPTPMALRKEVAGILDALDDVKTERDARAIIEDLNQRVREYYQRGWRNEPRVIVRLVDEEATIRDWRARRRG